ncbi:MAG: hypothetical protein M1825_003652 [Sarcosagium campestre]|nr:MAG: hypothetical protein M1825_003652 [Sarcosagium campestre]
MYISSLCRDAPWPLVFLFLYRVAATINSRPMVPDINSRQTQRYRCSESYGNPDPIDCRKALKRMKTSLSALGDDPLDLDRAGRLPVVHQSGECRIEVQQDKKYDGKGLVTRGIHVWFAAYTLRACYGDEFAGKSTGGVGGVPGWTADLRQSFRDYLTVIVSQVEDDVQYAIGPAPTFSTSFS